MIPGLVERLAELRGSLAVDSSPRNVMRVAEAHWIAGRADEAARFLEPLVTVSPGAIAPRVLLGWCYEDVGRVDESAREFSAARALDPANPFLREDARSLAPPVREPTVSPAPALELETMDEPRVTHEPVITFESEVTFESQVTFASEVTFESEAAFEPAPPPELAPAPEPETTFAATPEKYTPPIDAERLAEPEAALTPEELRAIPPSGLLSATLGEIFERQGFDEKAIEIYREVVRRHPERADLLARIEALQARAAGSGPA